MGYDTKISFRTGTASKSDELLGRTSAPFSAQPRGRSCAASIGAGFANAVSCCAFAKPAPILAEKQCSFFKEAILVQASCGRAAAGDRGRPQAAADGVGEVLCFV